MADTFLDSANKELSGTPIPATRDSNYASQLANTYAQPTSFTDCRYQVTRILEGG